MPVLCQQPKKTLLFTVFLVKSFASYKIRILRSEIWLHLKLGFLDLLGIKKVLKSFLVLDFQDFKNFITVFHSVSYFTITLLAT